MSNNDIQALKLYHISSKDIDENGNINPDARLIPLYYRNYNIDPATVTERLSDHDIDADSNIHNGRMFDIDDLTEFGLTSHRHLPVKTRGQSVLGYTSKDNAKDTYANSWRRQSPYSKGLVHIKNKNGEEYDEPVQYAELFDNVKYAAQHERHQPFDSSKETIEDWDKRGLEDFYKMILRHEPSYVQNDDGEHFYKVPVLITADKADVVNNYDIIKDGYDPGRDFLWDKQLKAYKMKQLPSGIFVPESSRKEFKQFMDKLESELNEPINDYNIAELSDYLNRSFDTFNRLAHPRSNESHIPGIIDDKYAEAVDRTWNQLMQLHNLDSYNRFGVGNHRQVGDLASGTNEQLENCINAYLNSLYDYYEKSVSDTYNNSSLLDDTVHKKIKYPDLKDIFDYDNPLTLSDAQCKQVFMDLSNDRKHENILKGLNRRY